MKKILFLLFVILFHGFTNAQAQGNDVIFVLDNSGSISDLEFSQMKQSTDSLIMKVLKCNPKNRVTVVHYGTVSNKLH